MVDSENLIGCLAGIVYLVVGFIQLFAIADALTAITGLEFGVFLVALFVTYIPLVGQVLGVYGAVSVWGWAWWQAGALYFWFVPAGIVYATASWLLDRN